LGLLFFNPTLRHATPFVEGQNVPNDFPARLRSFKDYQGWDQDV
jgi:hypothetical protein